ncbi:helix-turn-helix domain-containing protein [Leisingera sp. XS_AS12]|uniref:helix-turn-helix domain-containing protein n=1 Tax=Leisingera sp. XS_AS12 TaxID=3241294 RepID=UPI003514C859
MHTSMPAAQPRRHTLEVCRVYEGGRHKFDRWELLSLVTELRQRLGLNDRDILVLRAHLSVLPHGPLDPTGLNVSFMSVSEILSRACGMDERRFRRGEARLEAAGLVRRKLSANGRRFPERDREGRIVSAYGIDLSPLLNRVFELRDLHEEQIASRLALRNLRNEISARFAALTRAFASVGAPLPQSIENMRARLRRTLRRKAPCPQEMRELQEEIMSLEAAVPGPETEPAGAGPSPRSAAADNIGTASASLPDYPSVTSGQTAVSPDKTTGDDGQTVRHIESEPKEKNNRPQHSKTGISIANAWSNASIIREYFPETPNSEHQLARVLMDFSGFLGLGQMTVLPAIQLLGPAKMILLLNYLGRNIAQIARPEAYLRSLLRNYERGEAIAGGLVRPAA